MFDTALVRVIDELMKAGNSEFEALQMVAELLAEFVGEEELENKLIVISGEQFRA